MQHGINTVEVSAHGGARPLCAPYQGRIYSLDGSSGTVKDGSGNEYSYEPLTSTSYGQAAGLFGINCGHHNYPFKPGINFKRYFPLETEEQLAENSKQYKAFQKQRALERNIRAAKRDCMMCDAAGDKEGFAKASQKLARRKEAYSNYCKSAGFPQRKDRTQVCGFDKSVSSKAAWANKKAKLAADKGLTSGAASGKIKENGLYRKTSNTGAFAELPEKMSKKHIRELAEKYDIDIKGLTINIDKNEELLRFPFAGEAVPEHIGEITFFPNAFKSEEELVRTLFHERVHVMQFKKYGSDYVQNNRRIFEDEAEALEREFVDKFKKAGLL